MKKLMVYTFIGLFLSSFASTALYADTLNGSCPANDFITKTTAKQNSKGEVVIDGKTYVAKDKSKTHR